MIVMPGFTDTHRAHLGGPAAEHRHRRAAGGAASYISFVLYKLASAFRPEDAYIGDLISALARSTPHRRFDLSHIQGSPAHTDAVVQALRDSGLRAVFAYGFPGGASGRSGSPAGSCARPRSTRRETRCFPWRWPRPAPSSPTSRSHATTGSSHGRRVRITTHVGVGSHGQDGKVQEMGEAGLLGS